MKSSIGIKTFFLQKIMFYTEEKAIKNILLVYTADIKYLNIYLIHTISKKMLIRYGIKIKWLTIKIL